MRYFIPETIPGTDLPNIPTSGYLIPVAHWPTVVHPSGKEYSISYPALSVLISLAVESVITEPCVWTVGESGAHTSLVALSSKEYRMAEENTRRRNMNIPPHERIPGHVYLSSNTGEEVTWLGKIWRRTFTSPGKYKEDHIYARMEKGTIIRAKEGFKLAECVRAGTLPEMTKRHDYVNGLVIYSYDQLPATPEVRVVENTMGMILQTVDDFTVAVGMPSSRMRC